jgi:protein-S-isoprenylcysteine O-methyltransferase Ste14
MTGKKKNLMEFLPSTITSILLLIQVISGIYFLPSINQIESIAYVGVTLYILSGLIFGMLPVFAFRNKGRVKKGKSYIHTTRLVDTGIYGVVRHPQYVTFMLWAIAGIFLFQNWIVLVIGLLVFPLMYYDLYNADKDGIKKFGEAYKQYMKRVPRANFLLGIIRLIIR